MAISGGLGHNGKGGFKQTGCICTVCKITKVVR